MTDFWKCWPVLQKIMLNRGDESCAEISDLVLVHGWSMHSEMWGPFADTLAEKYRVTCIDLPGHGNSAMVDDFNLESVVERLLASSPERAAWIGWSLGATLVLHLASKFPDRISKVIGIAGNARFVASEDWPTGMDLSLLRRFGDNLVSDNQSALLRFLTLQCKGLRSPKKTLRTLLELLERRDPPRQDALVGGLKVLETSDLRKALKSIACPALLMFGEFDHLVPVASAEAIQKISPDMTTHVVRGASHMPFYTHFEETYSVVNEFLSEPHR